jgi:hypothetical protein
VTWGAEAGLWLTVLAFGVYHGLNPAMGWPLAVANGLTARRDGAVFATGWSLGAGHFLAMAVVLVPFALLAFYVEWSRALRIAAAGVVVLFGLYRLIDSRHPRFLARVRPTQLTWWSFLMATAHGAGLMLVPVALGLCAGDPAGASPSAAFASHEAVMAWMRSGIAVAIAVSVVHTLAMIAAGLSMAWLIYRYLGLRAMTRTWINVDGVWAASLVITGALSLVLAMRAPA